MTLAIQAANQPVTTAAQAAPLECPKCETVCAATYVAPDYTTTYCCSGNGHRKLFWRIGPDGEMLHGEKGNQQYR